MGTEKGLAPGVVPRCAREKRAPRPYRLKDMLHTKARDLRLVRSRTVTVLVVWETKNEISHVATDDTCRDLDLCDAIADVHYDRSSDYGDCQWNVRK